MKIGDSNPFYDCWKILRHKGSELSYGDVLLYAELLENTMSDPPKKILNVWHARAWTNTRKEPGAHNTIVEAMHVEARRRGDI